MKFQNLLLPTLSVLIAAGMVSRLAAETYGSFEYLVHNNGNEATITGFLCDTEEAIIPATIAELPVTAIHSNAFKDCTTLRSATIPDGVTEIGVYAFSGCSGLETITIPGSVVSIGYYAFSGCASLADIALPEGLESLGESIFEGCTSLSTVNLPVGVGWIPHRAFVDCTSLTSLVVPDTITAIGFGAFGGCTSLGSLHLPQSVTLIGHFAFSGCSGLKEVNLPGGLDYIWQYTFLDCSSMESITIPGSVHTIDQGAFQGCSSLTSIAVPRNVGEIKQHAFAACSELREIAVDPDNPNYASLDGVLFNKDLTRLIQCPGGRTGTYRVPGSVQEIGPLGAFMGCSRLARVIIPESTLSIGAWTFEDCVQLQSVLFTGNPPAFNPALLPFENTHPDLVVEYIDGTSGWEETYAGISTAPFCWGSYIVYERSGRYFVNTMDWLGELEVSLNPFVWHADSSNWLYIPEATEVAGSGWVYFYNLP